MKVYIAMWGNDEVRVFPHCKPYFSEFKKCWTNEGEVWSVNKSLEMGIDLSEYNMRLYDEPIELALTSNK